VEKDNSFRQISRPRPTYLIVKGILVIVVPNRAKRKHKEIVLQLEQREDRGKKKGHNVGEKHVDQGCWFQGASRANVMLNTFVVAHDTIES
jgi:hypothetical protein